MNEKKHANRTELIRTIKFVLFSVSAGVIEIGTFTLLYELFHWEYWAAYLVALVLSVLWNFTLNREFTFRSASNVPAAMLKVAAYYAVFTPLTTILGNYLEGARGWNGILVTGLNMLLNFVTEYLYDRFVVFGKSIDTNSRAKAKGNGCKMRIIEKREFRSGQGPWLYRLVYRTIRRLTPEYTLYGTEKLPETPCVLIGNHCLMYGPIAGEIYMPRPHYVWCIGEMMNMKELPDYAFQDFWSGKPGITRWIYRLLSYLIAPLASFVLNSAHTIPVYHDMRIMTTVRQSIACLENGMDVVVFPEKHEPYNGILWQFHEHFPDLARIYYKNTSSTVHFVPMYIAPKLKGIWFGDPVLYDPEKPYDEEKKRIRSQMMTAITEMATALPPHKVVPYINIPESRYPMNTDCEV